MTTDTILLVEDDENDAFFVERAMHKIGMANPVRNVRDGQQAIDYLRGTGKFGSRAEFPLPGLVLLDLKLPLVMGLDVLKWIRQTSVSSAIVIILTSSAEPTDIAAAYRLGANAYLVKPSTASELEAMLAAINGFWLLHNTPPFGPRVERRAPSMGNFRNGGIGSDEDPSLTGAHGRASATLHRVAL